jgi:NADP-dependent 3-hydroxy acid dehydrogenase YdfG
MVAVNGANAFTEALRQEMIGHRVRVSVVEPGTVDTELASRDPRPPGSGQRDARPRQRANLVTRPGRGLLSGW